MSRSRKFRVSILILALVTVAMLFWLDRNPFEPSYRGRSLSQVLQNLGSSSFYGKGPLDDQDCAAIQAIGTNGIPFLMRWLAYKPGKLQLAKTFLREKGHDWFGLTMVIATDAGTLRQQGVPAAFSILGSDARPAIPQLMDYATNSTTDLSLAAIFSLTRIGEPAAGAICYLMTNQQLGLRIRQSAIANAWRIRTNEVVTAEMRRMVTDTNASIRSQASYLLENPKFQHPEISY